nr:putative reverse transcriptase domain-containing protein [Tanacetum cinerariifolium]
MSSDNAQSAVTYMSISSDSDGPSWVKDNVEDPEEDLSEEHKLEDEDTKEPSESSNKTEPFEEDETVVTPPSRHQSSAVAARAPRGQYDFVDTVEAGQGLIRSAAITWWNGHVRTLGYDAAYAMTWGTLKKKLTDKYCPKGKIKKLEIKLWNLRVKGNDVAANTQRFQELALMDNTNNNNSNNNKNQKAGACYECGNTGYIKKNSPKLKNRRNGSRNGVAQGRAYALGGRDASPDSNVITGTFLLNNRYAKILFDTGADRSFVSTTFNALIYITATTLENHYDVELADGKIIRVNTIIHGCTLNFMN